MKMKEHTQNTMLFHTANIRFSHQATEPGHDSKFRPESLLFPFFEGHHTTYKRNSDILKQQETLFQ